MRSFVIISVLATLLVMILSLNVRLFKWSCQSRLRWDYRGRVTRSRTWAKWACAGILLFTGVFLSFVTMCLA